MDLSKENNEPKVSVLVPVYNEESTVLSVLQKLAQKKFIDEIVVVDDASQDRSAELIQSFRSKKIRFITHKKNAGKTAAIATALAHSTGDIITIQDADLEYDPNELEDVLRPILEGLAEVVYGSRFLVKKATRVLYYYHYLANTFITFLSNLFTNLNMTDIETCYKAFRREVIEGFPFQSKGFGMEVELTAMIAKLDVRVYEVPISYYGRTYEEGKKIGTKDGLMAIFYIFYFNLVAPLFGKGRRFLKDAKERISQLP